MLQLHTKIEQNLNFHFKKCLWFCFFSFSFLPNCKYFRTSPTQLCFTIFPPCLYHFYINSHHVASLALNGQSENNAHKVQLVRERQLCEELRRHKGRTNCMNLMLSVQGLTGLYYFDRFYHFLHAAELWEKQAHKDIDIAHKTTLVWGVLFLVSCLDFFVRKLYWIPRIYSK